MKRTHKLKSLSDVQAIVDRAATLEAAAVALKVNRSTLTRWMQQGKVTRPRSAPAVGAIDVPVTAEGWKASVLEGHDLSQTDCTLVAVADDALHLARDAKESAFVRLGAMGKFAAIVRQLNLDAKRKDASAPLTVPRPAALARRGDPRSLLRAVK